MDAFMGMQKCLTSYPELYADEDADIDLNQDEEESKPRKKASWHDSVILKKNV